MMLMAPACFSQNPLQDKIMMAAVRDLPVFLEHIPPGKEGDFGFESRQAFSRAGIGMAYPVVRLHRDFFSDKHLPDTTYLEDAREWLITVQHEGKHVMLMTLAETEGHWQAVNIGASKLARQLDAFAKNQLKANHPQKILRIYPLQQDFLLHWEDETANNPRVYPLLSAKNLFLTPGMQWPCSLSELLPYLRENIQID